MVLPDPPESPATTRRGNVLGTVTLVLGHRNYGQGAASSLGGN